MTDELITLPSAEDLDAVAEEDRVRKATSRKATVAEKAREAALMIEMKRLDRKKKTAYRTGERYRKAGTFRLSPYYEDEAADMAFYAGFDGKPEPTLDELLAPVIEQHV